MIDRLLSPRVLLHCEGLALCAAAILIYGATGGRWLWFAVFFLAPDLAMIGYAAGPRIGAWCYNAAHTLVVPLVGALVAWRFEPAVVPAAALWIAHIGADRALGYGLKYPTAFRESHFDRV
jgi:hypothetical protein